MGLGEQDGYPSAQAGQLVALRAGQTDDQAFAAESAQQTLAHVVSSIGLVVGCVTLALSVLRHAANLSQLVF